MPGGGRGMYGLINKLQLALFHYAMNYYVQKERADEAERQAEYYRELLLKVYATNEVLMVAINGGVMPGEERYG